MGFFEGARGRLHYREWAVEQPVAGLILLPGLGQHSGHYHRFARQLNAHDIQVWALDTAGHGLSEGDPDRPGTLRELVDDAALLIELVRAEQPDRALALMGHSLGGVTALAALGAAIPASGDDGEEPAADAVAADYPVIPAPITEALSGVVLCGVPKRALGGGAPNAPGTPLPRELPVLAVHGVDDRRAPITAIRVWTRRHEWVDLREYADAGHDLLHEPVHARVGADIAEWVRSVVGSVRHR
ncbi:alpha/beta hydrolase [Nocardia donostiensis]|uniref:alpha/beta hydrolase n=1 Tax=Nocardia donostiensis TaxID=1538463 RepID=UPI0009DB0DF8|nr:alpha/beta hydrolase [Nocardia donostiensis]OQS17067.1 alpha/beta hydrolase [Nocardia donostiensis]